MPREFEKPHVAGGPFRLGDWFVEPSLNRLSRDDTTIQLELKVMDVLVCLAERAGEVVTRQEIVDRVWATEFISDNTLTHAITELRNALGDDARNPSFIETIHRRGYRVIAPVEAEVSDEPGESKVARFPVPERTETVAEDRSPYPGLAAFTEADAEFFFGREGEVGQMWRKLTSRRLLAVIGPSGVGKSSFLRAGVIPARPEGWGVLVCQPGETPFAALARSLVPEFAGDIDATAQLVDIRDGDRAVAMVSRWRDHHGQGLFIVDQFEELFTLNPAEVQESFSEFLRRLVNDADVHVLLSLRDDFLFHVHDHPSLSPILDELTLLGAPSPESLRLALVEPARRLDFAFEDEDLPGEMIAKVKGERGALPLLAFAVARLWDTRDRGRRLLTRQAYEDMGGVGGALGQHAEATLRAIGDDRLPIVREIFRNLATAEGTRAVREVGELLSIFPQSQRTDAETVLRRLVDARLLTSFEEEDVEGDGLRRVEVVHESLLTSWPRLVRWQTQDADAAQLRDQLRQAARTWDEHDRTDELLWTGSTYREFAVWRERYAGGLTELEEDFARAMSSYAKRRKRRRRLATATALLVVAALAVVFGVLWRQSELETRRAEAANLLSRAQLELESYPSAAVAYATASLERSDSPEARSLALEALWKGPTALVVNDVPSYNIAFNSDGRWLVQTTDAAPYRVHVIGADGSDELLEDVHEARAVVRIDSGSAFFATMPWGHDDTWALWSTPENKLLTSIQPGSTGDVDRIYSDLGRRRALLMRSRGDRLSLDTVGFDGSSERLGTLPFDLRSAPVCRIAPDGGWFAVSNDRGVFAIEIAEHELSQPRHLGYTEDPAVAIACDPLGRFVAAGYGDGQIRLWSLAGESPPREILGPSGLTGVRLTTDGSLLEAIKIEDGELETWIWWLETAEPSLLRHIDLGKIGGTGGWVLDPVERQAVSILNPDPKVRLWPLQAPADAEPTIMQRGDTSTSFRLAVHPQGRWAATSGSAGLTFWPLVRPYPAVIKRYEERVWNLVFGPEGRWLAASDFGSNGTVRIWQLEGDALPAARTLYEGVPHSYGIAASPNGKQILLGSHFKSAQLLSLGDEPVRTLPGTVLLAWGVAFSPDGRFAAAAGKADERTSSVIRVWDLASYEEERVFDLGDANPGFIQFTGDGHLLSGNLAGLLRWNLETGASETLFEGHVDRFAVSPDDARVLFLHTDSGFGSMEPYGHAVLLDLVSGSTTPLTSYGDRVTGVAMNAAGTIVVTGDIDGVIRVGPITGGEPQMLLGNRDMVRDLAVDPRGRWIASASGTEVRLWPMPDLSKPPLHTLPRDELIAKLKTLTNLRVVRDKESATGWKLKVGPFPGWETAPEW